MGWKVKTDASRMVLEVDGRFEVVPLEKPAIEFLPGFFRVWYYQDRKSWVIETVDMEKAKDYFGISDEYLKLRDLREPLAFGNQYISAIPAQFRLVEAEGKCWLQPGWAWWSNKTGFLPEIRIENGYYPLLDFDLGEVRVCSSTAVKFLCE